MGSRWVARSVMVMVGSSATTHLSKEKLLMIDVTAPGHPAFISAEPPPLPLTVTHILEHLYCPRFTYFEYVLGLKEHQERRQLVQKGRQVHLERKKINPQYLRKKLGVVERRFDVPLASAKLGVRGIVDEVLTL